MERIGLIIRMGAAHDDVQYLNREQNTVVKVVERHRHTKHDDNLVRRIRNHFAEVNPSNV